MATIEIVSKALETFVENSKGARPKDAYEAQHWEMAGVHSALMNGLISIYEQAPTVPSTKHVDFVGYALQWVAALHHHHEYEEETYYPMFNPKLDTSFIAEEHATFTGGLGSLEEYFVSCLPSGTKYGLGKMTGQQEQQPFDGDHARALIDAFVNEFTTHMLQEITYIEADKLRAAGLTEAELRHIADVTDKHIAAMPGSTFLTYVFLVSPKGESEFPPAPAFVKKFLVPFVFYWPNRRLWQFAPKQ